MLLNRTDSRTMHHFCVGPPQLATRIALRQVLVDLGDVEQVGQLPREKCPATR